MHNVALDLTKDFDIFTIGSQSSNMYNMRGKQQTKQRVINLDT